MIFIFVTNRTRNFMNRKQVQWNDQKSHCNNITLYTNNDICTLVTLNLTLVTLLLPLVTLDFTQVTLDFTLVTSDFTPVTSDFTPVTFNFTLVTLCVTLMGVKFYSIDCKCNISDVTLVVFNFTLVTLYVILVMLHLTLVVSYATTMMPNVSRNNVISCHFSHVACYVGRIT